MDELHGHIGDTGEGVLHNHTHNLLSIDRISGHIDCHCATQGSPEQDYLTVVQVMTRVEVVYCCPSITVKSRFTGLPRGQSVAPVLHQEDIAGQCVVHPKGILQPMTHIPCIAMKVDNGGQVATPLRRMMDPEGVQRDLIVDLNVNAFVRKTVHRGHRYEYPRVGRQLWMVQEIVLCVVENAWKGVGMGLERNGMSVSD